MQLLYLSSVRSKTIVHQTIESNGSSKHQHGTLQRETMLPTSGNWLRPAGPSGYLRIIRKLPMAKVRLIWCLEK